MGSIYTYVFYKQPVYNQLALGRQIAKQFPGLNPLAQSNNKNCRLKTVEFFFCYNRKTAVKPRIHQNQRPQKHY